MVVHFTRKHTNYLLLVQKLLLQCCQIIVFFCLELNFFLQEKANIEKEKNLMAMFFFNHIDFIAEAFCKVLPHKSETRCLVVKNMLGPQTFPE